MFDFYLVLKKCGIKMSDLSSENIKVPELINKCFTQESWNDLPEAVRTRYLNMYRNDVEGKNTSLLKYSEIINHNC